MIKKLSITDPRLLIVLIIIIAAFLRLYNITQLPPGLYPDEAMNGNDALQALRTSDFRVFYPENNGREGLFMNIQAVFLKFLLPLTNGNPEPWMLRLPSAIFGILTVLGVYFLAKELFGRRALFEKNVSEAERAGSPSEARRSEAESQAASERLGERDRGFSKIKPDAIALLSAFFLAASFWHILFSRIGFRAIMAPFFLVWGIYFLLLSLRKYIFEPAAERDRGFSKIKPLAISALGGIFYGLGFYSYIAYRITPLLILIIFLLDWFQNKEKQIRKKILLTALYFLLFTFITALPIGIYFLHHPADFFGRTAELSVSSSPTPVKDLGMNILKTAGMFNFSGDWNWRQNYAGRPELFWPVGILFLVGLFFSLRTFFEKMSRRPSEAKPQAFIVLFSWLIITALPVVISDEGIPHALRSILMIPPVFILAGIGGWWLYELLKKTIAPDGAIKIKITILNVFVFIFLSLLVFEAYHTYFILWGRDPNVSGAYAADYVKIGRELNSLPKELPKYVVVEASGVDVRGIPMPAQTVMYITDTFASKKQKEKNIYYVLPNQLNQIPKNSYLVVLK